MIRWFHVSRMVLALAAFAGMSSLDSADAFADACEDCKQKCREGVKKCKDAAPKGLCKGPAKIVCDMFKGFQCPAAGSVCRQFDCGTSSSCDPPPPAKGGKVSGDPHVYSLDRTRFDFQGAGEYALAHSEKADVEMQVRFSSVNDSVSVTKMLAIRSGGHRVVFTAGAEADTIMVDTQTMKLDDGAIYISESVSLHRVGGRKYLMQIGETQLWVAVSSNLVNLTLEPDPATKGTWQGLLGDFDGVAENDFRTREGKAFSKVDMTREILYGEFGNSWRLSQSESFLVYGEGETTATFTDKDFPLKHRSIADFSKEQFQKARAVCIAKGVTSGEALRNCIYDVGITDSEDYAAGYADIREIEAERAFQQPGKLAMQLQDSSYQGSFVPLYWSGAADPEPTVTLHNEDGKKIASTRSKGKNPISLRLPSEVGKYTAKLNQGDQSIEQAITVTEASATLTVPETVEGSTDFTVSWTGPLGKGDFVSLVKGGETKTRRHLAYFWASRTKEAVFQAPATPGDYEIWYVLRGSGSDSVIAKKTVSVGESNASVAPPASAVVGSYFPVPWTGPDGKGDFIDLVNHGHAKTTGHLTYQWASRSKEGAVKLRAPAHPGKYDIRYIASTSGGRAVLATGTVEVTDTTAEITAPATAIAGEKFEISWAGPTQKGDFIGIGPADAKEGHGHIHYVWAKEAGKALLRAPSKAGSYELRYILQGPGKRRVLTRKMIVVKEK